MTTQPSIESLRDAFEHIATMAEAFMGEPVQLTRDTFTSALTELESLRASEAALRAERESLRRQIVTGIYDGASVGITLIKTEKLEEERARLTAAQSSEAAAIKRAEEAEKNYHFMVERAADERLDGYRELGMKAAEAEQRADAAEARCEALEAMPPPPPLRITFAEATILMEMFGGDTDPETTLSVDWCKDGHSGQGLYAWFDEYPEEGSTFLSPILSPAPDAARVDSQRPQVGEEGKDG